MKHLKRNLKWLIWFSLGLILVLLAYYVELEQALTSLLQWVDSLGTLGAIAFVAIYIIATTICIPGSIMALAGGALFGKLMGTILVFVSGFLGACCAFGLGRYLLSDWVKKQLEKNSYLKAVNRLVVTEGWKIACLLHLSPIVPFNLLNYVLGTSEITYPNFLLATSVGILPGVILYVFLGSTIGDLTMVMMGKSDSANSTIQWVISAIGILATVALTIYLAKIARQHITNKLQL